MRSFLVIGLGRFGRHLAIKLSELGNEVLAVDQDEDAVTALAPLVTRAQVANCMDVEVLKLFGVRNFDICFVCIGESFQASLEITSQLKDLGAAYVVSKTDRDIHAKFLLKVGADEVIYPERDMARRAAIKFSAKNALDYIELTPDYAILEILVPSDWIGKSVRGVDVRSKHNINIIGRKAGEQVIPITDPGYVFAPGDQLFIAGNHKDTNKLMNRK